jgi:hypothetical protein
MDYAVLLHLALLCGPVPGPAESDAAWLALRPVTGQQASRAAIAAAVLGESSGPAAQAVGQCLLRLRGAGDKKGRRYDPPLLAAVDRRGHRLPPEARAGADGYHGYLPLPVFGTPAAPSRREEETTPEPLDTDAIDAGESSGLVKESALDTGCGRVQRPPRKGRREEPSAEADGKPGRPGTKTVPSDSSLRSETEGTESREDAADADTVHERARQLGLKPFLPMLKAGDVEDSPQWRRDLSYNVANTAMSVAGATARPELAKSGADRKRAFEPWRLAVERLLEPPDPVGWRDAATSLAALLVEEGPGTTGGADDPRLHGRVAELLAARARLHDGRTDRDVAALARQAAAMVGLAVEHWRGQHPPVPPAEAGQPEHPPF